MKKIILSLLLIVFLISIFSTASAYIQVQPASVWIEKGKSSTVSLEIENSLNEKVTVKLHPKISSVFIEADIPASPFSLNASEKTEISMNVYSSNDAPDGFYEVEAVMDLIPAAGEEFGKQESVVLRVNVASYYEPEEQKIELIAYPKNFCIGGEDKMQVRVENNTQSLQKIRLWSDSEAFLPMVSPNELELETGEARYVELRIYTNSSFSEGDYSVELKAATSNQIFQKTIDFSLVKCFKAESKGFRLSVNSSCSYMQKDSEKKIYFYLENRADKEQEVKVAIVSNLETVLEEDAKNVFLEKGERKSLYFTVVSGNETEAGEHTIRVYAFNSDYSETQTTCVSIGRIHLIEVEVLNDNLKINRDSTKVFEILVKNKGDYREKLTARALESPSKTNISFSEDEFTLDENEELKLYVSVSVWIDAEAGEKKALIRLKGSNYTKDILLNYTVLEEEAHRKTSGVIEFESIPQKINIAAGKSIMVPVMVKNISEEELSDIRISIKQLPSELGASSPVIKSLVAGESEERSIKINSSKDARAGVIEALLVVENDKFVQSTPITIVVEEAVGEEETEEEEQAQGFLAGLAVFGTSILGGIIAIIIVLVVVFVIARVSSPKQKQEERNPWAKVEEVVVK